MPSVGGILETALTVADLPTAVQFYKRLFGFRTLLESERLVALEVADRDVLLLFRAGETVKPLKTPGGIIPPHDGTGQSHLAFSITAEDVAPWQQRLESEEVPIESSVHWPGGAQSLYFRDPDRHLIELLTPGLWPLY